jgi:hypothetical protein
MLKLRTSTESSAEQITLNATAAAAAVVAANAACRSYFHTFL